MPVACTVALENIQPTCDDIGASGGIQALYVIQRENVVSYTASTTELSYTAVTLDATTDFYAKIEPVEKTAVATFTGSQGDAGGNSVELNIEAFLPNQESVKGFQLQKLLDAGYLNVIVHFNTGKAFVYGYDEKLTTNAQLRAVVGGESGTEFTDRQGYTPTFEGTQVQIPRQFIGTITTFNNSTGLLSSVTFGA